MNLENRFKPFIEALISGMKQENWLLSVMCACTLPDICTSLEGNKQSKYYVEWFNNYVKEYQPSLSRPKGFIAKTLEEWENRPFFKPEDYEIYRHVFFSGVNAYALRCAILHNGNGNLFEQPIQSGRGHYEKYKDQILDIETIEFKNDPTLIFDKVGKTAYINPEKYCMAIVKGVSEWIEIKGQSPVVQENASKLLTFE